MRSARGFTLVELVMVIVLLAIVATISVQFVTYSTRGAIDTGARQQRSLAGAVISEQVSRALREALPRSVRTNGNCIEWMPIEGGTNYLTLPVTDPAGSFSIVPFSAGTPASGRIVVYPDSGNLYASPPPSPGPVSPSASIVGNTVTFDAGAQHQYAEESPRRRLFLIGNPRTFCHSGTFIELYTGYGIQANIPAGLANRQILAANVTNLNFDVVPPTLERGAVVSFALTLTDPQFGESLDVSQEVQIRNVP